MFWIQNTFSKFTKILVNFDLKRQHKSLEKDFSKTTLESTECMEGIYELQLHAKNNNWTDISSICNVIWYILWLDLDFRSYLSLIVTLHSDSDLRKKWLARSLLLVIYEGILNIHNVLWRDFRCALNELKIKSELIEELDTISKELWVFKRNYEKELSTYRHNIIAHREQNFQEYTELMKQIDPTSVISLSIEFNKILHKLAGTVQKIFTEAASNKVNILQNSTWLK